MNIQENISLKPYNTFGIDKKARFFTSADSVEAVITAILKAKQLSVPLIVLGGGSNLLLTKDLDALVLKIDIKGIQPIAENEDHVFLEVGAGENWHAFVLETIQMGLGGVENLSLIPGTVGASPMQNIGAYGVEIKEVFHQLTAVDRETCEPVVFDADSCNFGYRESVFKRDLKDRYIITQVVFRLFKKPVYNLSYGAIQETLEQLGHQKPTLEAVSQAVIAIRQSKLPDPALIGNAGSFFKNPTVPLAQYAELKERFPSLPGYANEDGMKIPAAWLIEQTGWKGKRVGNVGVHQYQPLVLVNFGGGEGSEIQALSEAIQKSVADTFGINLHPEVNFY
jgi:UDP-N-acetylmuramate dehydrogenase